MPTNVPMAPAPQNVGGTAAARPPKAALPRRGGGKLMTRRNNTGWVFIAPFLLGFLLFYGIPLVQALIFSFSDIQIVDNGFKLQSQGWEHYNHILFVDPNYIKKLISAVESMALDTIIVVPFSFFSALILSREFKGRAAVRAIFFLPVVLSTGVLATMDSNSTMDQLMARSATDAANAMGGSFSSSEMINTLLEGSMPESIITFMTDLSGKLYDVIIKSGLQIIMFMSGLNTISPSLYESSSIEGATAWENFWKITFPMCGPYLLLNVVYTIIDSFTNISNPIISTVKGQLTSPKYFGVACAEVWVYFIIIGIVLGVAFSLMAKRVFYHE